ncbi:Benzoyl-CoA reductase/2-hydroxyglutaryl-CoA dehydratase subunit, BcrC/BadD/HgdB [Lachnospiraceae bacterium XBB1006]|nr:Benzoyl-CoA reductase/2-hydroxyglutaryl-CoA dehydratase subunit, BcrC/BadD/HgdB [Lachnospiraceae bacterium XBB1006]
MNVKNQDLPEIFENFSQQRKNSFLAVKAEKEKNTPVVGMYCTYFPKELVTAMGGITASLCATSEETIPDAEMDLPKNLCPLIKSSYGFAKTDKCPYFYFSDLVVGETTCDGKKKMFEYLKKFKPVHIMELPNSQGQMAFSLWKEEVIKLKEKLEEFFGVTITDEKVEEAIHLENEYRKAARELCETMKLEEPPMSGKELFSMLRGSEFRFDKKALIAELKEVTKRLKTEYEKGENHHKGPRILITGCPMGGVFEKVLNGIEENGGVVVCYENCNGMKNVANLVEEKTADPYAAIARRYLDIGCSVMTPNPNRYESLTEYMKEYRIDGVVEVLLPACHTYAVESGLVKEHVRQAGVPYISITTDYGNADEGQLKTRLTAFLEML